MGGASDFIVFLISVFNFLIQRTIDLICLALLLISLCVPWRTFFILKTVFDEDSLKDFRIMCGIQFLLSLADIFTIIPFALTFVTIWRWPFLVSDWNSKNDNDEYEEAKYDIGLRLAIWKQCGLGLLDIPCSLFIILITITMWRAYPLYEDIDRRSKKWREHAGRHFVMFLLEILFIPAILVVFGTLYRIPLLISDIKDEKSAMGKRGIVLYHMVMVLIDIPFFIMAIFVFVTLWRAPPLFKDLVDYVSNKYTSGGGKGELRESIVGNFFYVWRDLPAIITFVIIFGTLYRIISCITKLREPYRKPLPPKSFLKVTSFEFKLPERGMLITIRGTKDKDFHFSKAKAFIIGPYFFDAMKRSLGNGIALVVKAFLPAQLCPKYMNPEEVESGSTEFSFNIRIGLDNSKLKRSTVEKKLVKLKNAGDPSFDLVVEFGKREGILFRIRCSVSDLLLSAERNESISMEQTILAEKQQTESTSGRKTVKFYDHFFMVVLTVFLEIILDIICVIVICCLLVFPWRLFPMILRVFQSDQYRKLKKCITAFEKTDQLVTLQMSITKESVDVTELLLKYSGKISSTTDTVEQLLQSDSVKGVPRTWTLSRFVKNRNVILLDAKECAELIRDQFCGSLKEGSEDARKVFDNMAQSIEMFSGRCDDVLSLQLATIGLLLFGGSSVHGEVETTKSVEPYFHRTLRHLESNVGEQLDDLWKNELLPAKTDSLQCLKHKIIKGQSGCPFGVFERSWMETRVILFKYLYQAFLDVCAIVCFIFILILVYRFPLVLYDLIKWRKTRGTRMCCFTQAGRIMKDVLFLLEILVVILTIYRIIDLILALSSAIVVHRSLEEAREVTRSYVLQIGDDIKEALKWTLLCGTYRIVLATLVFGIFMPAESISQLLSSFMKRRCVRFITALFILLLLYLFPIIMLYLVIRYDSDGKVPVLIVYFLTIFGTMVASIILCAVLTEVSVKKEDDGLVRANWPNINVWLELILEFMQLSSLAFISDDNGAKFLQLSFLEGYGIEYYSGVFWFSFSLVVLYFVLSAACVVLEDMLEIKEKGAVSENSGYQFWMSLLSTTLFMFIATKMVQMLSCNEVGGSDEERLVEDKSVVCWTGSHLTRALLAFIGLSFFVPTAFLRGSQMVAEREKKGSKKMLELDILFSAPYVLSVNCVKAVTATVFALASEKYPAVCLWVLIVCCLGLFFFSLFWRGLCTIKSAQTFRTLSFLGCSFCAVCNLMAYYDETSEDGRSWPYIVLYVSWSVLVIIFIILLVKFKKEDRIRFSGKENASDVMKIILEYESSLSETVFFSSFASRRRRLHNSLKWGRGDISDVKHSLSMLERGLKYSSFYALFDSNKWLSNVTDVRSAKTALDILKEKVCSDYDLATVGERLQRGEEVRVQPKNIALITKQNRGLKTELTLNGLFEIDRVYFVMSNYNMYYSKDFGSHWKALQFRGGEFPVPLKMSPYKVVHTSGYTCVALVTSNDDGKTIVLEISIDLESNDFTCKRYNLKMSVVDMTYYIDNGEIYGLRDQEIILFERDFSTYTPEYQLPEGDNTRFWGIHSDENLACVITNTENIFVKFSKNMEFAPLNVAAFTSFWCDLCDGGARSVCCVAPNKVYVGTSQGTISSLTIKDIEGPAIVHSFRVSFSTNIYSETILSSRMDDVIDRILEIRSQRSVYLETFIEHESPDYSCGSPISNVLVSHQGHGFCVTTDNELLRTKNGNEWSPVIPHFASTVNEESLVDFCLGSHDRSCVFALLNVETGQTRGNKMKISFSLANGSGNCSLSLQMMISNNGKFNFLESWKVPRPEGYTAEIPLQDSVCISANHIPILLLFLFKGGENPTEICLSELSIMVQ